MSPCTPANHTWLLVDLLVHILGRHVDRNMVWQCSHTRQPVAESGIRVEIEPALVCHVRVGIEGNVRDGERIARKPFGGPQSLLHDGEGPVACGKESRHAI
jgi:hypothetical protein